MPTAPAVVFLMHVWLLLNLMHVLLLRLFFVTLSSSQRGGLVRQATKVARGRGRVGARRVESVMETKAAG